MTPRSLTWRASAASLALVATFSIAASACGSDDGGGTDTPATSVEPTSTVEGSPMDSSMSDTGMSPDDTIMRFPEQADRGPQWVPTVADPLHPARVRDAVDGADVVHLAPIMGEVDEALARSVTDAGAPFVGITPQGLLRDREPGTGRLLRLPSLTTWWSSLVDAAVVSEEEHAQLAPGVDLERVALAVTRGERGCYGRLGAERTDVAGIELHDVDPASTIGAGDVFAAACFVALAEGEPFPAALERANSVAAANVGRSAPGDG